MDFRKLYDAHVRFVWRVLLRLGVLPPDVPDAAQEVFVVAHRKLPEFEGRSKPTTWLFTICARVAADRRKLAYGRRERPTEELPLTVDESADAGVAFDRRRARQMLDRILDRMPDEQRIVFSMFELDEMTGEQIAELLDVPVGTIRSRLRLARKVFDQAVLELQSRERHPTAVTWKAREA